VTLSLAASLDEILTLPFEIAIPLPTKGTEIVAAVPKKTAGAVELLTLDEFDPVMAAVIPAHKSVTVLDGGLASRFSAAVFIVDRNNSNDVEFKSLAKAAVGIVILDTGIVFISTLVP
jgi:hypothetical protein